MDSASSFGAYELGHAIKQAGCVPAYGRQLPKLLRVECNAAEFRNQLGPEIPLRSAVLERCNQAHVSQLESYAHAAEGITQVETILLRIGDLKSKHEYRSGKEIEETYRR